MSTVAIIIAVVVIVLVLLLIAGAVRRRKHAKLRDTFGPEYDRTVGDAGKRKGAKDLAARKERHDELELTPLDPIVAQRYRDEWRLIQERFVDAPAEAVASAHALLQDALNARGYPTSDDDERVAMLSVDHADVLDRYRQGMRTEQRWRDSGSTDTEELRQAMQHFRSVFDRVLGNDASDTGTSAPAYPGDTMDARTQPQEFPRGR